MSAAPFGRRQTLAGIAVLTLVGGFGYGPCAAADTTYVYEAESFGPSASGAVVDDPAALNHQALVARIGREMPGIMRFGPYSREPAGRYRADFRLKVKDNTVERPVVGLDVSEAGGVTTMVSRELKGTDFENSDAYQVFSLEFDRSDIGAMEYRIYWRGNADVSADRITVTRLKPYGEAELLQIYSAHPELLARKPPSLEKVGGQGKIFVCNGLWHEYFHLEEAMNGLPSIKVTWGPFAVQQFKSVIQDFPEKYEDLYSFDAVVLADCDASSLGMAGKRMLSDYVHDGGGLVVLGGLYAYGRGGYVQSKLIGDLLPVKSDRIVDLRNVPQGVRLKGVPGASVSVDVRWSDAVALWYHKLAPRAGAIVAAKLGDDPALAFGTSGKGRVACLSLAPMGVPPAGQLPFWDWDQLAQVLAFTIKWVTQRY